MLRRIVFVIAGIVLALVLVGGITGILTVRRSYPQIDGEVRVAGLDGPVEVFRDSLGVPHIYAATTHDLFFAQGYVHAQDRFWQMDFARHIGTGRLSEMFGDSEVDTDRFLRNLGWSRIAEQELKLLSPETAAASQAYADGVNAYISGRSGSELSLEYAVLSLLNPDYQPEPWQPLHSLVWGKVMAWDLGRGKLSNEIELAALLKTLTPEQVEQIAPAYPADKPVILPGFKLAGAEAPHAALDLYARTSPALEVVAEKVAALDGLLGKAPSGWNDGIGSNSWVIAGERTATGKPLLANDMHLGVQMPAIWYEVGLHCTPKGPDCPFEVTGFTFPAVPGVVVGHNDRVAWGFTNLGPDVLDLYIEKINPQNPDQYEVNGQWVEMEKVKETIQVAGGEPVEVTLRYTRHGPVISDTYGPLEDFEESTGIDLPEDYAVAMRWTALEPNRLFEAILGYNKAQNWEEFRRAAQHFAVPPQNTVFADVDGNIGYQAPGWIPVRVNPAHDGRLPVPGWTDEYEWQGYIPFEEMPYTYNPPQGYVVTANNAVVDKSYPYLLGYYFAYGDRAARIVEMIENAPGPITAEYVQSIHGDGQDANARNLVPLLLEVPLQDQHLQEVREILRGWDYQNGMDSAPAALFNAFWKHLLAGTFHDDLPEDYWPGGGGRWFEVVRSLVKDPGSPWWDDQSTSEAENRDAVFTQAFAAAVAELENAQGKNPEKWNWGDLHTVEFRNPTLGESGIAPVEALFNRGPFRTAGGDDIINATGWSADEGYTLDSLPSERLVVDLADLSRSLSVITTGQSGHAFHPHYVDMADLWRMIQYHPMLWTRSQVEGDAEGLLRLVP